MSARESILSSIRARKGAPAAVPSPYVAPKGDGELVARFAECAARQSAEVRMVANMAAVPEAVADILRSRNMAAEIHVAPGSPLQPIDLASLDVRHEPPAQNDAALTLASFGIAATGTLAFFSGKGIPASWHFRPVLEIAVLPASSIVGELEDVLAKHDKLPSTLNLITGPSRTGDIEQTMELGAHGPKGLAILIVRS